MADTAEYGTVLGVETINLGTTFAVDAGVGATTLTLTDTSMFNDLGGQVYIDSNVYTYTGLEGTPTGSVTFDAVGPSSAGAAAAASTTLTWNHTCGASAAALVVAVAVGATNAFTTITVSVKLDPAGANTSFVSLGSKVQSGVSNNGFVALFGLANVASGAHVITVTASAAADMEGGSISYLGAGTTTGTAFSAQQTNKGTSQTATVGYSGSTTGNRIVAGMVSGNSITNAAAGTTSRFIRNQNFASAGGNGAGADRSSESGSSLYLTWGINFTDEWGAAAVEILAASTPTGDNRNVMTLLTGLLTAATADTTRADIYPPAPQRTALIQYPVPEAEAVRATIPYFVSGLPDGVREPGTEEIALIEDRGVGELYVRDVMNKGMILLGPGENLDNYTAEAVFIQLDSTDASTGTNYPVPYAGILEVISTQPNNVKLQRYSAYRNAARIAPSIWVRTFGAAVWSAWEPVNDDTGWISTISSVAVASANWTLTDADVRRINKTVQVKIVAARTTSAITVPLDGDHTNVSVCQMLAAYRPTGAPWQTLASGNVGRGAHGYIQSDGQIVLAAVVVPQTGTRDVAVGESISLAGTYFLD